MADGREKRQGEPSRRASWTLRRAGESRARDERAGYWSGVEPDQPAPALAALLRWRWLALGVFVGGFAPLAAWLVQRPVEYEAVARLAITAEGGSAESRAAAVESAVSLLTESETLARVVETGELAGWLSGGPSAVENLRGSVAVERESRSGHVRLLGMDANAGRSAVKVNAWGEAVVRELADRSGAAGASGVTRAAAELLRLEGNLTRYRGQADVAKAGEDLGSAGRRLAALERELAEIESRKEADRTAELERLRDELTALESQRTDLLSRYEPGYRLVTDVEKRIAAARAALARVNSSGAPSRQAERVNEINAQIARQRSRRAEARRVLARLEELEQSLENARQDVARARADSAPSERETVVTARLVERALPPVTPRGRSLAPVLAGVLAAALLLSIAAVALAQRRNRPVGGTAAIAALAGAPVLTMAEEPSNHVS